MADYKCSRLWDVETLMSNLGVKRTWIYSQTCYKKMPFKKVGRQLKFDPIEIDAWLEQQPGCSVKPKSPDDKTPGKNG